MRLKKETLQELKKIMLEDYSVRLSEKDLEEFAYSLVGYIDILIKGANRGKVQK